MIGCHKTIILAVCLGLALPLSAADIAPVGKSSTATTSSTANTPAESDKEGAVPNPAPAKVESDKGVERTPVKTAAAEVTDNAKTSQAKQPPAQPKTDPVVKSSKKLAYTGSPNSFNRLMKPPSKRNLPPAKDGIHDPKNDGTHILQAPRDSFSSLPKANSGNRVDWVTALESGEINPRYDRLDPEKVPIVLDLNIVREVKGSMPDVVYPHKQHTEWLDCSNCHPAIFIPMKGANNISMASILLGEKCGVCHGKVAFPVSECRKCHSKNKTE